MTAAALRMLARVHGVLAWVAIAAAVVAIVALWRRRASAAFGAIAAVVGAATFATGAALHAPFQTKLRQRLFLASNALGWMFERKEHVAFGAIALLGSAAAALWAGRVIAGRDDGAAASLRRASAIALVSALAFQVFALVVSIAASRRVAF